MKQIAIITINLSIDEENEDANYDYANEIAYEMLDIARRDDYKATVDVDID
jgi:hypothetical protein